MQEPVNCQQSLFNPMS